MILTIARELSSLFIDDGRFALSVAGWLAIVWFVLPGIGAAPILRYLALFTGLENSVRRARR
jgi:hypothetical protein